MAIILNRLSLRVICWCRQFVGQSCHCSQFPNIPHCLGQSAPKPPLVCIRAISVVGVIASAHTNTPDRRFVDCPFDHPAVEIRKTKHEREICPR